MMFTKAITRKPCRALIDGITTAMYDDATPVYERAVEEHDAYVATLKELGLEVEELDADERYPDSCFVEDPAVVMERCAIITNPARDSRNGEKDEILPVIKKFYSDDQIFFIEAPGTMEGGDVMRVGDHFYIGQSERTNAEAARQFNDIVTKFGYTSSTVPVTEGLHLKDFVIYLENNNMLVSPVMNEQPAFKDFNRYVVEQDELYAINSLYINGTVIVPEGYPKTQKYIEDLGYPVKLVDTSEFRKIDGSLTCLSLRF
ncbi:MAG: arginine deiminase-related protein [Hornefia butyriciproducens]|nr:arginine deiminase-related protein [Clostridiales bacterium]MDY2991296.1 arginine deiminase-related protein [Hornefia butyriciproducens]